MVPDNIVKRKATYAEPAFRQQLAAKQTRPYCQALDRYDFNDSPPVHTTATFRLQPEMTPMDHHRPE
jgi:hypothetical protein